MHEEVRIMWAEKITLILSMVLPAAAYADNEGGNTSPLPTQNPPNKAVSHIDYLGTGFFNNKERSAITEPDPRIADGAAQSKNGLSLGNQSSTLHWEQGEQHPILEYRISEQGSLHLHISKHGTTAGAQWKF
jgi:hypothetical protein